MSRLRLQLDLCRIHQRMKQKEDGDPYAEATVESDSRAFLIETFAALRDDLIEQMQEGGATHRMERELPACEALLAGLNGRKPFPDDEETRQFVTGLARAADEGNDYEQAALEHRAFAETIEALGDRGSAEPDWDALLVRLLNPTQLEIIEALRWIDRPLSASQLFGVFDESVCLTTLSYHCRRLKTLGVVKRSWTRKVRGATERFYRLRRE